MKKKFHIILLSAIMPALIVVGAFYYFSGTAEIVPEADWINHYGDVESLVKASDIIITGKVIGATLEQRADLIFTLQEIKAERIYKGNLKEGETISVLQTGGELNGIKTKSFKEAPLWDKGNDYLLFLQHTNEGNYLVLGGYQGSGKIENNNVTFNNVKNDEISKALSGKSFSSVNNILIEQIDNNSAIE